jgi:endonuclease/exonuclease/phosphatase family metal-dependent hydrolase
VKILRFTFLLLLCNAVSVSALIPPQVTVPPHETATSHANDQVPALIGCWNLEWFPGRNPRRTEPHLAQMQIDGVKRVLAEQQPGIFFACEVRSLEDLKKLQLDYPYLACTEFPRPPGDDAELPNQGLAILSRHPWQELWALDFSGLPAAPNRPPRGIIAASFSLPNQQTLTIYGMHMKSNHGDPAANRAKREAALDYLEWDWQRRGLDANRDFIIVLGDFNTSLHDPVFASEQTLRRLRKLGFSDTAEGMTADQRITIPANNAGYPDNDFDHIFISKPLRSRLASPPPWVKIVRVPFTVSDHYPLFIDVKIWFGK